MMNPPTVYAPITAPVPSFVMLVSGEVILAHAFLAQLSAPWLAVCVAPVSAADFVSWPSPYAVAEELAVPAEALAVVIDALHAWYWAQRGALNGLLHALAIGPASAA